MERPSARVCAIPIKLYVHEEECQTRKVFVHVRNFVSACVVSNSKYFIFELYVFISQSINTISEIFSLL